MFAPAVTFQQAKTFLASRQTARDIWAVLQQLDWMRSKTRCMAILHEINPRAFAETARAVRATKPDPNDIDPWEEAALNAINDVAPLDQDAMMMRMEDGESCEGLYPAQCGYAMDWVQWNELTDDPTGTDPAMGLYIFVTCIRMGAGEKLFNASEKFGWDLEFDPDASMPEPDWDRLWDGLARHNLTAFQDAINVCLYSTDNLYFDYNPWDENQDYGDLPPFSLAGVRSLQESWREAQPILNNLRIAIELFSKDGSLARTLWDLFVEASEEDHPARRTLADMWAQDDEDEDNEDHDANND